MNRIGEIYKELSLIYESAGYKINVSKKDSYRQYEKVSLYSNIKINISQMPPNDHKNFLDRLDAFLSVEKQKAKINALKKVVVLEDELKEFEKNSLLAQEELKLENDLIMNRKYQMIT
jgi:hypothetical protein